MNHHEEMEKRMREENEELSDLEILKAEDKVLRDSVAQLAEPYHLQQVGESLNQYNKFLVYASIPPGQRTYLEAWRRYSGKPDGGISSHFFYTAKHWSWEFRADYYDQAEAEREVRSWIDRDARRRLEDYNLGTDLIAAAMEAFEDQELSEWSPTQLLKVLELGTRLRERSVPPLQLESDTLQRLQNALEGDRLNRIQVLLAEVANK